MVITLAEMACLWHIVGISFLLLATGINHDALPVRVCTGCPVFGPHPVRRLEAPEVEAKVEVERGGLVPPCNPLHGSASELTEPMEAIEPPDSSTMQLKYSYHTATILCYTYFDTHEPSKALPTSDPRLRSLFFPTASCRSCRCSRNVKSHT